MACRTILLPCLAVAALASVAPDRNERFFDRRVWPVLRQRCLPCHNAQLNNGGLSLTTRENMLKGGGRGPALVPGNPERSLLIQSLRHDGDLQMPPGPKLPAKEIQTLTEWVKHGAQWGRSPAGGGLSVHRLSPARAY